MRFLFLCALLAVFALVTSARAGDPHAASVENGLLPLIVIKGQPIRPASLGERMAFYRVPGVSVAFFDEGGILWTLCRGVGDVERKDAVTPSTVFQASSISKVATALAALRLVREGRLALDEDVNTRLTSWQVPLNEFTRKEHVTLRRLLSHNAGVGVHGFSGYAPRAALPTTLQILEGVPPANNQRVTVEALPGSGWSYSGGGYVIVQQLIMDVTRKSFAGALHSLVLEPAHMTRSTFVQPLPKAWGARTASGHQTDGKRLPGRWAVFPEVGPAGLWSTPSDLARMAIEIQKQVEGTSEKILTRGLAQEMVTRQAGDWGLGVELGSGKGEPHFGHTGNNPGFQSALIFSTRARNGVAIMTNGNNQSGLFYEIVYAVAKEYGWAGYTPDEREVVAVDPGVLKPYAGRYLASGAPAFEITANDARLFVVGGPFGDQPLELLAESPTRFFILSTGFRFEFATDDAGKVRLTLGGSIRTERIA